MKAIHVILVVFVLLCAGMGAMLLRLGAQNASLRGELETYRQTPRSASASAPTPAVPQPALPAAPPMPADVAAVKIGELNAELQALRLQMKGKDKVIDQLQAAALAQNATPVPAPTPRPNASTDWMNRLKTENPERYERLVAAQKRYSEGVQSRVAEQGAFILELDPATLPADQQEKLIQLQEGFRRLDELMTRQAAEGGDPNSVQARRDLYSAMNELRPLLGAARQAALRDFARQVGYNDRNATEFVDYINHIFDLTGNIGAPSPKSAATP